MEKSLHHTFLPADYLWLRSWWVVEKRVNNVDSFASYAIKAAKIMVGKNRCSRKTLINTANQSENDRNI